MRKILVILLGVFCVVALRGGFADAKSSKKSADVKVDDKAKLEQDRRKELENSEWEVYTYAKGTDPKKAEKDTLIFKDRTVVFKNFEKKGYPIASYSLVINPDQEGGSWETYQRSKEGSISIRGDWKASVMNGVISEELDKEKKATTYYFSSQIKKPLEVQAPAEVAAAPALQEPAVTGNVLVSKETPADDEASKEPAEKKY